MNAAPPPTTMLLVRHGVTAHTTGRRFSGGLTGANPELSVEGRGQAAGTAAWLAARGVAPDLVIASPVRRTRETADEIATVLGVDVVEEHAFAEMDFGDWEGKTFGEVAEADKAGFETWLSSMDAAPPGGESIRAVQERVMTGLERVLAAHAGRTVVVVSHVTPIKVLVARALETELDAVFRMQLEPASVSVLTWFADHRTGQLRGALKRFNALPPERADAVL